MLSLNKLCFNNFKFGLEVKRVAVLCYMGKFLDTLNSLDCGRLHRFLAYFNNRFSASLLLTTYAYTMKDVISSHLCTNGNTVIGSNRVDCTQYEMFIWMYVVVSEIESKHPSRDTLAELKARGCLFTARFSQRKTRLLPETSYSCSLHANTARCYLHYNIHTVALLTSITHLSQIPPSSLIYSRPLNRFLRKLHSNRKFGITNTVVWN